MSIMDLPSETLHQILSHSPKADILAMTYTCQHFHSVAEPLLYESITWNSKGPKSLSASPPDEKPSKCNLPITFPIHLLLARLLNQLELGKHIKKIMIEGHWPESIWTSRRHEADAVPSVLLTRLAKIGAEVNNGTYTMWLTELHEGHPDLFIILLLSFCPRLQVLIPGLGLHSPGSPVSIARAISKHSALTTLYFPCSSMPGRALRHIIASASEIQYLHLDINADAEGYDDGFTDSESLAAASNSLLMPSNGPEYPQNKLRELVLSLSFLPYNPGEIFGGIQLRDSGGNPNPGETNWWGTAGTIGILRNFEGLESLDIDPVLLFGWSTNTSKPLAQLIPDSLKKLILRPFYFTNGSYEWHSGALRDVMYHYFEGKNQQSMMQMVRDGRKPKLETLVIAFDIDEVSGQWPHDVEMLMYREVLEKFCIENGIGFYCTYST